MDNSYIDLIPAGTKLYRSKSDPALLHGYWYGFTPEDTFGYGNITAEFETTREHRIINVLDGIFYNDYISKLNKKYKDDYLKKFLRIYGLGIKNINLYKTMSKNMNFVQSFPDLNVKELVLTFSDDRPRYSEDEMDKYLFETLKLFYGSLCDGFYWPIKTLNILENKFCPSEFAVFDNLNIIKIREIPRPLAGGDESKPIVNKLRGNAYLDSLKEEMNASLNDKTIIPRPKIDPEKRDAFLKKLEAEMNAFLNDKTIIPRPKIEPEGGIVYLKKLEAKMKASLNDKDTTNTIINTEQNVSTKKRRQTRRKPRKI
jgi:hypothetical protein